jgi:hypothetical protein
VAKVAQILGANVILLDQSTLSVAARLAPIPAIVGRDDRQDWQEADCAAFIAQVCEHLPVGISLRAWHMMPLAVWHGRHARLLKDDLNFHPFGRLNVMLLPADAASADVLGLPVHPGSVTLDVIERAELTLDKVADQVAQARVELNEASLRTALAVADATVFAAANLLADKQFGRDVYKRHLKLFGQALGWAHARKAQ